MIGRSPFVKSVTTLMTGTVLGQAITLMASPFLTRIYTPAEFGIFALFMAFVTTIAPGVTGRYEVALLLPRRQNDSMHIFGVAIWFGMAMVLISLIALVIFKYPILTWLNAMELNNLVYLVPIMLLATGFYNLGIGYSNRIGNYKVLAKSKVVQAIAIVSLNITFGLLGAGFLGLFLGNFIGVLAALSYLIYSQRNYFTGLDLSWSRKKTYFARRYIRYPTYNASASIVDGLTLALPTFYFTSTFSFEVVGFYVLVYRVIYAPLRIISSAVTQVSLRKIVELTHHKESVTKYLYKIGSVLLIISIFPTIFFIIWGPDFFAFVFGQNWERAGQFSQIISLSLSVRFVSSISSSTFGATNNNHLSAGWIVLAFFSTLSVLMYFSRFGEIETILYALVINDIILYSIYFLLAIKAANSHRN